MSAEATESGNPIPEVHEVMKKHGVTAYAVIVDLPDGGHGFHYVGDLPRTVFWLETHAKMETAKVLAAMNQEEVQKAQLRKKLMGH